jgi:bacillithiol system protein YtxJ
MGWHRLDNFAQVGAIVVASAQRPQLIFKHSTRCSISAAAKYRLEASLGDLEGVYDVHFLDLIVKRDISTLVADRFDVEHQSPQVIVVHRGKAIFTASHYDIDVEELMGLRVGSEQR